MTKQTVGDIDQAEVQAVQAKIDQNQDELLEAIALVEILSRKNRRLGENLEQTKKQAARLKRFIWTSDDPNIVELRNQLLVAAKLIIDNS